VQSAPSSKKARTLLKFMTHVSHDIDCQVVAEGVETVQQLECVRESGVDAGQGFLFAASLPTFDERTSVFIRLRDFASCVVPKIAPQMRDAANY
jgi:EAL domain-containing protein (putative c-di-GMP-specific phosphodiesterase class I)